MHVRMSRLWWRLDERRMGKRKAGRRKIWSMLFGGGRQSRSVDAAMMTWAHPSKAAGNKTSGERRCGRCGGPSPVSFLAIPAPTCPACQPHKHGDCQAVTGRLHNGRISQSVESTAGSKDWPVLPFVDSCMQVLGLQQASSH